MQNIPWLERVRWERIDMGFSSPPKRRSMKINRFSPRSSFITTQIHTNEGIFYRALAYIASFNVEKRFLKKSTPPLNR